jgi:hypothetical protein
LTDGYNPPMSSIKIKDKQWHKIVNFLWECPHAYVGQEAACRRFVEGVLWIIRSDGPQEDDGCGDVAISLVFSWIGCYLSSCFAFRQDSEINSPNFS